MVGRNGADLGRTPLRKPKSVHGSMGRGTGGGGHLLEWLGRLNHLGSGLEAGAATLRVSHLGYDPIHVTVQVSAGENVSETIALSLQPSPSRGSTSRGFASVAGLRR